MPTIIGERLYDICGKTWVLEKLPNDTEEPAEMMTYGFACFILLQSGHCIYNKTDVL